jgi:hypothetical protein
LRADTFQHRVRTDAFGHVLDACDTFIATLGHYIRGAECEGELLTRLMTAHRDDPLGTHYLGR